MSRLASRFLVAAMATLLATGWMTAVARPALAAGSVSLTTMGVAYGPENFNGLATSGTTNTTLPNGWWISESGTNANQAYGAGTGSNNAGDTYSWGNSPDLLDRALGGLRSGSLVPTIGASFTNNTGGTIAKLTVAYRGEMWRAGVTNRGAADRIDFQLSTNATSLASGTWSDYDSLDFNSPNLAATAGAINGNNSGNFTNLSFQITGLAIASGATFWIRWTDFDISSSDDGLAVDDFSLTPQPGDDVAPTVADTTPTDGREDVANDANITIEFSEDVTVTDPWFDLTCEDSGSHTAAVSGESDTRTLDPDEDFNDLEYCTVTVEADNVADADGNDPPDTMEDDFDFTFQVGPECDDTFTPIYDIQGTGSSADVTGTVDTEGVVVGDFEGTGAASGFYIQDPDGDGDDSSSDGIFVFAGSLDLVEAGDYVRVRGFARERFNETAINGSNANDAPVEPAKVLNCGTDAVDATDVSLPFDSLTYPERYEGMSVRFPQSLVISEYFNYDQFGEIVLALPIGDESRPFTGTAIDEPGDDALARAALNARSRITLDDARAGSNPTTLRHPNGAAFSVGDPDDPTDGNLFRGGDLVANATGVLGFAFSLYRIYPTAPADYTSVNPRPLSPEDVGGTVKVAAMNTLNFFITADVVPNGGPNDNVCGGNGNVECRGWDSNQPLEFDRQRDKLLQALVGLDADVLGLNELENSPVNDPLGDEDDGIVAGLNELLGDGTYDFIDTGIIGTDAIRVGLIYKPGAVTPVGEFEILDSSVDERFVDTRSRPSLAQTFYVNDTGARFTVVVNHLKSKGSACTDDEHVPNDFDDPDAGDGQGNCNGTRTAAAEALVDWLADDPTNSGDPDFVILGDLNSYAMEDPIDAIKAGSDDDPGTDDDFTNLISAFQGAYAYSYTFDGQAGYLDHALGNATFTEQVTGAADWHINSDEPDILDYDTSFKPAAQEALYEPNQYRTSDHDPAILGADLTNAAPTFEAVVAGGCLANGGMYSVTIDDYDLLETELTLELTSNTNTTLVPNGNVSITGTDDSRQIAINAANNQSGTATLTLTLSDGWNTVDLVVTVKVASGDQSLSGTSGEDILLGGPGENILAGNGGADILCGGKGEDILFGGDGDDWLDAGIGDDDLSGGTGADRFIGGKGVDINHDFNAGEGDTTDGT